MKCVLSPSNVKTEDRGTYWGQYKNAYTDSAVAVVRLYVIGWYIMHKVSVSNFRCHYDIWSCRVLRNGPFVNES